MRAVSAYSAHTSHDAAGAPRVGRVWEKEPRGTLLCLGETTRRRPRWNASASHASTSSQKTCASHRNTYHVVRFHRRYPLCIPNTSTSRLKTDGKQQRHTTKPQKIGATSWKTCGRLQRKCATPASRCVLRRE